MAPTSENADSPQIIPAQGLMTVREAESSSDDPQILDRPPPIANPIKSGSVRAGSSNSAVSSTRRRAHSANPVPRALPKQKAPVRGKGKARAVLEADDDEPIFVGSSLATRLADKYSFKSSFPSISPPDLPVPLKDTPPPRLPLVAPRSPPKQPVPIPSWLGRTAVLLQLPDCVVCRKRWKKSDSGAARWVSCLRLHLVPNTS